MTLSQPRAITVLVRDPELRIDLHIRRRVAQVNTETLLLENAGIA